MKRILAILFSAMLVFSLAACGGNTPPASNVEGDGNSVEDGTPPPATSGNFRSIEEIQASGELIMLTNAAFPPFEYVEGTDPAGVDVDVARAIAADLGVELRVVDMDFDGLIAALKSGRGDLIAAGMTIREDRLENVDFTVEYVTSAQYIVMASGSGYATLEDLAGCRIGVQLGTTGDFLIDDAINLEEGELYDTGASMSQYRTALEAAQDLLNGRLDAVVIDRHPATAIAAQNDSLITSADAISESESYAIAVDKGNEALLAAANETLNRLISDGTVDQFLVDHTS